MSNTTDHFTDLGGRMSSLRIPPLQQGDHLTVPEFERRYTSMPDLKKAELINGVVYIPSSVSTDDHAAPHFEMIGWRGIYCFATLGVQGGDNATLRLRYGLNQPQPDALLRIHPTFGGLSRTDEGGYVLGAPELVAEIAATSAAYDLHEKLEVYRLNGVREYIVWRVYDAAVDWFVLRGDRYEPLVVSPDGLYRSEVFPGLWLDPAALIRGDGARISQVALHGIASPEHAAFVVQLQARATKS
jgi:Uma2 family endonuclease